MFLFISIKMHIALSECLLHTAAPCHEKHQKLKREIWNGLYEISLGQFT